MSLKTRVRKLEAMAEDKLDRCPRCGGKHFRTWASWLWGVEHGEEACTCEECGCAELLRLLLEAPPPFDAEELERRWPKPST